LNKHGREALENRQGTRGRREELLERSGENLLKAVDGSVGKAVGKALGEIETPREAAVSTKSSVVAQGQDR
jgi:hypothetical protein